MIGRLRELREDVGAVVFGGIVVGSAIVVVGGLVFGGIEISNAVSNSTAKSTGNAQVKRDTNSGSNQEQASGTFQQLYAQIGQYQHQIQTGDAAHYAPGSLQGMQLTELQETCQSAVSQYNADAQTITMQPFLPQGYPTSYPYSICD